MVSGKIYESLAISRTRGNPNLFITMTCTPNHPSILNASTRGVSPSDRTVVVLQIFFQQVLQLTKLLIDGKTPDWEPAKGITPLREFQKRGLPHIHILSILDIIDCILAKGINKYYVAEVPDKMKAHKSV